MATIITDGKGNYFTPDASGQNWVPTAAPEPEQPQGGHRFADAPPETSKQPLVWTAKTGDYPNVDVPGGGELPTAGSPGGWRDTVDTSITPRPGVATFAPLSRETPDSPTKFAIPNAVRALFYEGPQLDPQGKLTVPGATINQDTGSLGVTPEAGAAGQLLMPGGLRFGGANALMRDPVSAFTLTRSPNVTMDELRAAIDRAQPPANRVMPGAADGPPAPTPPPAEPAPTPPASAPAPASTVPLSADEILARSKSFFGPADQQAAQGAMIKPDAADGITGVLRDVVSTDPHKAIAVGNTPLVQLGKEYAPLQGQPMSFDAAMALDRRLTAEKRTAMRSDPGLAHEIGEAQGQIRDKMQTLGPNDTTGDPQALAGLQQARQAYAQWIKETQLDDIRYGASLLPAEKQDAYVRSQTRSLLKSDRSRNWTDDERAAAETAATQGVRGFLGNAAISIIKPAAAALGFKIGGAAGAWVGGNIGEAGQATLRDALARRRPDRLGPVSGTITQGVPPLLNPNTLMPPT